MSDTKPCFEGGLYEIKDCLEGTPEADDCNHLCQGGSWVTCKSGGQSRHLKTYMALPIMVPAPQPDYLALVREVKNLACVVEKTMIKGTDRVAAFNTLQKDS